MGSSVVLRCDAHGVPEPEVTWYKNGRQLAEGNGLKINGHQLEVIGVQVGRNALRHRCVRLETNKILIRSLSGCQHYLFTRIVDVCYLMTENDWIICHDKCHDNIHIDTH